MKLIHDVLTIVCLGLVAAARASGSSIEDRLNKLETQLEEVKRDNAFLKTEIGDLKHEDVINKQKISQVVQENTKLKSQVNSLKEDLEEAFADIGALNRKIQELESCGCGGASPVTPITPTTSSIDASTSFPITTEMTTWPINAEIEFIDVGFNQGKIRIFKDLKMLVVGWGMNKVYDLRTRQLVRTFGQGAPAVFNKNQLIMVANNGPITIWNVETGELVNRIEGAYSNWVLSTAVNKNQSLMLTGGNDRIVRLWDLIELKEVKTFIRHTGSVYSVIFDEARGQVISGSQDSTIRVWKIHDGSLVRTINGDSDWVFKLLLDEETGLLFSASSGTIKQWDIESGKELRTFRGHTNNINDLIFSEDGQRLISSSSDRSIIIWDKKSGQQIKRFNYTNQLFELDLNPLNGQLISTTIGSELIFWPVKP